MLRSKLSLRNSWISCIIQNCMLDSHLNIALQAQKAPTWQEHASTGQWTSLCTGHLLALWTAFTLANSASCWASVWFRTLIATGCTSFLRPLKTYNAPLAYQCTSFVCWQERSMRHVWMTVCTLLKLRTIQSWWTYIMRVKCKACA